MGGGECEVAYDDEWTAREPDVASAVDTYTRAEGPTDDLLDQFAGSAAGDVILLLAVSGRPTPRRAGTGTVAQGGAMGGGMGGRGGGRRGGGGGRSGPPPERESTDGNTFEITATLFSVRQHRTVASLALAYTGPSAKEAFEQFAEKFRRELPSARCTGWNWTHPIDAEKIRTMGAR